jgi:polyphosphate kinase
MSADWMTRNLDRRVEVGIPVLDEKIKQTLKGFFDIQWSDNVKARDLTILGDNKYVEKGDNPSCRSQIALYDFYKKMK